jgi:CRP-like cAMP-binding protein
MPSKFAAQNSRLKTDQLFQGLSRQEQKLLSGSGVTHLYKKGEIIFREGGIPGGIFYVKTGRIKKYKRTQSGGEQVIYICSEGEVLGYHALLADEYYYDSAATIEESCITFIPKEAFLKVLRGSAVLSNRLLQALGHEFSLYINGITNLATRTVRERLAYSLLILEDKFRMPGTRASQIEINISRADLASMVGTAKETVVRLLTDFKNQNLIEARGLGLIIKNRKAMFREANLSGQSLDEQV